LFFVEHPKLEAWNPNVSYLGQTNPQWTRLLSGDRVLTNSLEWAVWRENPVQVVLCEICGQDGCAAGGYVHVSRTAQYVVWTSPQIDEADDWYDEAYAIVPRGALLFRRSDWDEWSRGRTAMPPSEELPPVTGRVLGDAWRLGMPAANRADKLVELPDFVGERAVASDSLTVNELQAALRGIVDQLVRRADIPVPGDFVHGDGQAETVYFDVPLGQEWQAFRGSPEAPYPAVGGGWAYETEWPNSA